MELLELIIDENDESGVDYIALVDQPAVEKLWLALNKQKEVDFQFKIQDKEKRMLLLLHTAPWDCLPIL